MFVLNVKCEDLQHVKDDVSRRRKRQTPAIRVDKELLMGLLKLGLSSAKVRYESFSLYVFNTTLVSFARKNVSVRGGIADSQI